MADSAGVSTETLTRGASKVQLHVVRLQIGASDLEIPTELEPLGDKQAGTLATSSEGVTRRVLEGVLPTQELTAGPEIWIFHMLFGDAIPTNDAAAKILWALMQHCPWLVKGVRFFLLVVKCMVHQTGLSARSAVIGTAASVGGGELYKEITGVTSRLFKFLIKDYYEEFATNTSQWFSDDLEVVKESEAERIHLDRGQVVDAKLLQDLYTKHVVPDEMVELWNIGVGNGKPTHKVPNDADPGALRPVLVKRFTDFTAKTCLRVDEHPTITRFFTFRECCDTALTMDLIGMPPKVIKLMKTKPREENQKRMKMVQKFFADPEGKQVLRRTALVFQLVGGLEALAATNPKQQEGTPPIVRFVKGEGQDILCDRLRRLFGVLANDPLLKIGPAIGTLLATGADLMLRFEKLKEFPFVLVRLCLHSAIFFFSFFGSSQNRFFFFRVRFLHSLCFFIIFAFRLLPFPGPRPKHQGN